MTATVAKLMIHSVIIWNAQSEALPTTTSQLTNLSAPHGLEYSSDICQLQGGPLPEFVDYLDTDACGSCTGVCGYVAGKCILYSSIRQANGRAVPGFGAIPMAWKDLLIHEWLFLSAVENLLTF